MSSLEHAFLYLLLFALFPVWGYFCFKWTGLKFWSASIFPLAIYSLIVGARYGWGPDYIWYKYRFDNAFTFHEEQIGFRTLNQVMASQDFSYVAAFCTYSLIFMTAIFVLINSYKDLSKYMYAFVVPATLFLISGTIRQGVALSFLFLALYFFNQKKNISALGCILIGGSIHSSIYVTAVVVLMVFLLIKNPISWKISIPLYVFFAYFYDISATGKLANYVQYLHLGNKFQSYIDNSESWFGQDAINSIYEQGIFPLMMSSLFYCSLIYLGFSALQKRNDNRITYIYNSVVVGIVMYRAVFLFEILRRFAEPLVSMYFIVLGYVLYVFNNGAGNKVYSDNHSGRWRYFLGLTFIVAYLLLYWGRFVLLNPSAKFFWEIE